jgi:lipoprotein-releasing system permease protein
LYTAYFIAQRIQKADPKSFSRLGHKIGVVSIALGLAIMLLGFLSLGGFQKNVEEKLTSFQGQLQICPYAGLQNHKELPSSLPQINALRTSFEAQILSIEPYAHQTLLLKADNALAGVVCKGIDPRLAEHRLKNYLVAGQFLTAKAASYSQEIIVSSQLAATLQLQIGDEVLACILQPPARYRKLKLVGIYTSYLEELDEKLAFCDLSLIQKINAWPDSLVEGYEVFLSDPKQTKTLAKQLLDELAYDWVVKSTDEAYAAIGDWLEKMRKDVSIFLCLILLVAISNIIAIVLIQMMERTQMIGILKTIGATDALIKHIILWNNLPLVLQGLFWGNLLGLGLGALQSAMHVIRLDPTYYCTPYLPISWNLQTILCLNIGIFMLVTGVLWISIMLIARLRPLIAIRFQ